jgi:hypothetical protein
MAQPSDMEARGAVLETQVRELAERVRHSEQDAAAARVLAGGADRDVEQIRGESRDFRQATAFSFNAMREDLIDVRTKQQVEPLVSINATVPRRDARSAR